MSVPKFLGRDIELSTTGLDRNGETVASFDVTRRVLAESDAAFEARDQRCWTSSNSKGWGSWGSSFSTDCLRHWAPNGQCYYSDMGHVEVCTAETLRPLDFAAQSISVLRIIEAARSRASEESGEAYHLTSANLDLVDPAIAWGSHLNVSITPKLWEDLFVEFRHPAVYAFVTSVMAAAIPFFGTGYLLPFKDGTTIYSLSARAHHLQRMQTLHTTQAFERGLLNTRREPHGKDVDRLHLIGFDYQLVSAALLAAFLQGCLRAAEEGAVGPSLYEPVRAMHTWSWGLDIQSGKLPRTASLNDGRKMTLPMFMRTTCEWLLGLYESGLIEADDESPGLIAKTIELTRYAEEGALDRCAPSLDWAAKLMVLIDVCSEPGVHLGDDRTRLIDHDFATSEPTSLFWRLWEDDMVDPLVPMAQVEECLVDGPEESRAWARGRLIQKFFDDITDIDWSYVELRQNFDRWADRLRVKMPRLDSLSRASFESALDDASDIDELKDRFAEEGGERVSEHDPIDDIRTLLATDRR